MISTSEARIVRHTARFLSLGKSSSEPASCTMPRVFSPRAEPHFAAAPPTRASTPPPVTITMATAASTRTTRMTCVACRLPPMPAAMTSFQA